MHDMLIIGGGVIGLSLAWELAKHGLSVHVIDQSEPGREASWAGAGIIPAAVYRPDQHPYEQLRGLACQLHPHRSAELRALTGIDNGYRRCGALHLARTAGEAAALAAWAQMQREEGIEVERLTLADLAELEPGLRCDDRLASRSTVLSTEYSVLSTSGQNLQSAAFHLPQESQLRNPRHVRALTRACELAGVTITPHVTITKIELDCGQLSEIQTLSGPLRARKYCFTAGAWTGQLLARLGIATGILPIRGQMALFHSDSPPITRIINEGSRYLVPRDDGYCLAGSTEEEVGFDKRTTPEAIDDLIAFARDLVPALREARIAQTWAGLRPGSFDGLPYLGPLPGLKNAFVAAGHFRSGLYLSTATAVVMSELIRGEQPRIDLAPFRVGR
jgi:glycine oxidase